MKRNLRRILLCAALAGLPFLSLKPLDWVPVGDSVDTDGFALTAGNYENGDYIANDAPNSDYNQPFTATGSDSTLNVYGSLWSDAPSNGGTRLLVGESGIECPLKVNGNVVVEATSRDMTVNIKEAVIIESYHTPPVGGLAEEDVSHLYFKAGANRKITVNVDHDVTFRGKTGTVSHKDLLVTFAGRGEVAFVMADGTAIKFDGQVDDSGAQILQADGTYTAITPTSAPSANAAGTKVLITMEQTAAEFNADKNKVSFTRKGSRSRSLTDSQRNLVYVGENSLITFLSNNPTGLASDLYEGGYGAIGFDPSNNGTGRTVLFIKGAYDRDTTEFITGETETEIENPDFNKVVAKYPFNDGAVVVAGHYVASFEPEVISGSALPGSGETLTTGYDFSKPAGIRAALRVIDNKAFRDAGSPSSYDPAASKKRGLLVVNDVINHGKLMADPYWDLYQDASEGYIGVEWAASNPSNSLLMTRRGFVVGVNGMLDVYHNTFIQYAGGATNHADPMAESDYVDLSLLKKRNPSALTIDGIDTGLFITGNPFILNGDGLSTASEFAAANPYEPGNVDPVAATIRLRGAADLFMHSSASTRLGYMATFWTFDIDPINNPDLDWTNALALAGSTYDGYALLPVDESVQSGEGEHVLDVEGELKVRGISASAAGRTYAASYDRGSRVNAASVMLGHDGREVLTGDENPISRPLLADGTEYVRYNSPTLFFNNHAAFYNTILDHSDATKYVDGLPNISEPAITGGERLYFGNAFWDVAAAAADNRLNDPNRFRFPEIQLFNSELALHESLNASGVRFVVKDIPGASDISGSNTSYVRFYDHGDQLDTLLTGFGRVFQCGSALALMADGTNNYVTESCQWNVFKHNTPDADDALNGSAAVMLSLVNGDEFHPDTQAVVDVTPSFAAKQRAHHLFMFSQPPLLDNTQPNGAEPVCNMSIGWGATAAFDTSFVTLGGVEAPAADAGAFPGSYPYPSIVDVNAEPLVKDESFFQSELFELDAQRVPAATVSVDGSYICFGSFDQNGRVLPVPLATDNDSGAVYVKHGGKITASGESQAVFTTMLGQRIWNDYNYDGNIRVVQLSGVVDLPKDQVTFDRSFAVQPYNFTRRMFSARRDAYTTVDSETVDGTLGFVRLFDINDSRTPAVDKNGVEEALIGWFYKDNPDLSTSVANVPGSSDLVTNADQVKARAARRKAVARSPRLSEAVINLTRATESVSAPVKRPADMLMVSAGTDVNQLRVAGATMSDPFVLDVAGDGLSPAVARVREFCSQASTREQLAERFISEGAHAVLFGEFNGRMGLGSRSWNEHSTNAWNLLGKDYVTICPMGDMTVDVNSNLLVVDRQALVATDLFGANADAPQRLTFQSTQDFEIRVPAGRELDLSSFGQGVGLQQIAFGGKVKLVLESGATIRFPDADSVVGGVVLYFNDESQLVFEGDKELSKFVPFTTSSDIVNNAPLANSRIRIVGKGQIWLNKDAQATVNGNTFVGIETDAQTPSTDVVFSLARQSAMYIGTETLSGGAFQVGNAVDRSGHSINFKLALNGARALLHIDREGFVGLGAGISNKNGSPNGEADAALNPVVDGDGVATLVDGRPQFSPDTTLTNGVWRVAPLYNVDSVQVELRNGILEHKNIADGYDSAASLLAVGPANSFSWKQANQDAVSVRGGGNLMLVPAAAAEQSVMISDFAGVVDADGTAYSILASGQLLLDRANDLTATADFPSGTPGKEFSGLSSAELYELLACRAFSLQGSKRVVFAENAFVTQGAYVTTSDKYADAGSVIVRFDSPALIGGSEERALDLGALQAATDEAGLNPTSMTAAR